MFLGRQATVEREPLSTTLQHLAADGPAAGGPVAADRPTRVRAGVRQDRKLANGPFRMPFFWVWLNVQLG
jgi:hypothetical protein